MKKATPSPINADEARAALKAEEKQRVESCREAISEALDAAGCDLDIRVILTSRGVIPQIDIIPKP